MSLGERLLDLRKKKGLSQEEIAGLLDVSRQTVSKWETDQSTPDFDKIIPICKLYEIDANELLTGEKSSVKAPSDNRKSAKTISLSIVLYILSTVWIIFATATLNKPILGVCVFLIIIALATGLLIYNAILNKKEKKQKTREEKLVSQINEIITIFILAIYFIVSFTTMAWHITWILFIINVLIEEIVKLIFSLNSLPISFKVSTFTYTPSYSISPNTYESGTSISLNK